MFNARVLPLALSAFWLRMQWNETFDSVRVEASGNQSYIGSKGVSAASEITLPTQTETIALKRVTRSAANTKRRKWIIFCFEKNFQAERFITFHIINCNWVSVSGAKALAANNRCALSQLSASTLPSMHRLCNFSCEWTVFWWAKTTNGEGKLCESNRSRMMSADWMKSTAVRNAQFTAVHQGFSRPEIECRPPPNSQCCGNPLSEAEALISRCCSVIQESRTNA